MTQLIGRRRLEMIADRIEAVFATAKIAARVHGGTVGRHSAVFAVTFDPGHSLRQLMALKRDIELSVGHPVLIHHAPHIRIRVLDCVSL